MRPILLGANQPPTFYRGSGRLGAFRRLELDPRPEDWVASTTARFGLAPAGLTVLPDGARLTDAIAADPIDWLGATHLAKYGADPALLVKLLDAGQRLPMHAHPSRPFARSHLASPYGKTEAWIALDAAPDAVVHLGFSRDVTEAELAAWVSSQDVASLLGATNRIPVAAGDAILCPAGLPHAIGADVLLVELQEPTDFSVLLEWSGFPLDPADATLGLPLDEALACVDRRACPPTRLGEFRGGRGHSLLPAGADAYFRAEGLDAGDMDPGFSVLIVTSGAGELSGEWGALALRKGATVVIPYGAAGCRLAGELTAIRCRPAL
jgi:mannose-6-phosphate isomerase